jgi:hypothetical protein
VPPPESLFGGSLGLDSVTAREISATLDCLVREQTIIEAKLARRHQRHGTLVLYDIAYG